MTSKIINMAEKIRDAEDRLLETMFRAELIEDAGFSDRIIGRIRRGIWLRRLTLPVAMLIGGAIAVKSLLQLGSIAATMGGSIQGVSFDVPESMLVQLPAIIAVACLMFIGIIAFKLSEE